MASNEEFFRERRAAAVFKHGILSRYTVVFASKAGSTTAGNRVVFLDGYAGPGRYEDGSDGSPLLLAQSAEFVGSYRDVRGVFVESNVEHFANLQLVLGELGDPRFRALPGSIDEHLTQILAQAGDAALFAFLDPFGAALARSRIVEDLLRRQAGPTEVLLHFSLSTVARTGGLVRAILRKGRPPTSSEALAIANLDRFLGGTWWQPAFAQVESGEDLGTATTVAQQVAADFCQSVERETGFRSVAMPVRMRPEQLPKYLLVLFTRHPEGEWQFASALGKAGTDWHRAWRAEEYSKARLLEQLDGHPSLFDAPGYEFDPAVYERALRNEWIEGITANITDLLARKGHPVRLDGHVVDVYGRYLGSAWIPHVRAAVKQLYAAGLVSLAGTGEFHREPIRLLRQPT